MSKTEIEKSESGVAESKKASTAEVFKKLRLHSKDNGSADAQVALLSARIKEITEHLKEHPKDFATRRSLLKLVARRRRHMIYLQKKDEERYKKVLKELGLKPLRRA